jgi:NAD(P)-dependent dehydrogenase (short-subunit alcohol dehydrogenase family)
MPINDHTLALRPVGHCIITGHSRGLGQALCKHFLHLGWSVMGISRQALPTWTAQNAKSLLQIQLDLSDPPLFDTWLGENQFQSFLKNASHAVLINNSGVVTPIGPFGSSCGKTIANSLALNVSAPLVLSNAFLLATTHCRDRRIVHISSGAGRSAYAGWSVYGASKAALDHHARCVTQDKINGLRIASLAPGVIDTDMQGVVRDTTDTQFPLRQRFIDLKNNGELRAPDHAATDIVDYVLSEAFGADATPDIRSASR